MSTQGEVFGGSHYIDWQGKQLPVGLIDQGVKLDYERLLYARARKKAADAHAAGTPGLAAALGRAADNYDAGKYQLRGSVGRVALTEPWGLVTLMGLLTGLSRSEVMPLLKERTEEVRSLLEVIVKESSVEDDE